MTTKSAAPFGLAIVIGLVAYLFPILGALLALACVVRSIASRPVA